MFFIAIDLWFGLCVNLPFDYSNWCFIEGASVRELFVME